MSVALETTPGERDALKDFFEEHNNLDADWCALMEATHIDYDVLMQSTENDLKEMLLTICKLNLLAVIKILNAVRQTPESLMYRMLHQTQISIVSHEENVNADKIQKESARMQASIDSISQTLRSLLSNEQVAQKIVNDVFDEMIRIANQRRSLLLQQIEAMAKHKSDTLQRQQNVFNERVQKLQAAHDKQQRMMKDVTMDKAQRRSKIFTQTRLIINDKEFIDVTLDTNDRMKVHLDVADLIDRISSIGAVLDENHASSPQIRVEDIAATTVKVVIETSDSDIQRHQVRYLQLSNDCYDDYKDIHDEKLQQSDWKTIDVRNMQARKPLLSIPSGTKRNITHHVLQHLTESTKYLIHVRSENKNGFGAYSKCAAFKTSRCVDPKQLMVFDGFGVDHSRMRILNNYKVKCTSSHVGSSIRLKYGMPINARGNNTSNIQAVSWEVTHTASQSFPSCSYFIGVVSNKTCDFTYTAGHASGARLKCAFGLSGKSGYVYKGHKINNMCADNSYKGYKQSTCIKVEYVLASSTLTFHYVNCENYFFNSTPTKYTLSLPTGIDEITHWYPAISLESYGDTCEISNVSVRYPMHWKSLKAAKK